MIVHIDTSSQTIRYAEQSPNPSPDRTIGYVYGSLLYLAVNRLLRLLERAP